MNIIGAVNKLSYGQVTRQIVRELVLAGEHVSLFPIDVNPECEPDEIDILRKAIANRELFDPNAPCIRIFHQNELDKFVGKGPRIGFPIFELDRFNQVELHHMSQCDYLFVCSEWAKTICIDNGINIPIYVVPLGVRNDIFYPTSRVKNDVFNIHVIGKLEVRKSHDILPEILSDFKEDFKLNIMWRNPVVERIMGEKIDEWETYYKEILGNKVEFHPQVEYSRGIADFINRSDCGLYISKAEGFDLSLLETLACGKNVVVSNYSGHTEYCNKENSHLVEIESTELAQDGIFFNGQGNWAVIRKARVVEQLYQCYEKWRDNNVINYAGMGTAKQFTWTNTTERLKNAINDITRV